MVFYAQYIRRWASIFWVIACLLVGVSCCPFKSKAKKISQQSGFIAIQLASPVPKRGRTFASITHREGRKNKTLGFRLITQDGTTAFVVPFGEIYEVCVFCDLNQNQQPDEHEPIARSGFISPQAITTLENVAFLLDFGKDTPIGIVSAANPPQKTKQRSDLPKFSPSMDRRLEEVPDWIRDAVGQ